MTITWQNIIGQYPRSKYYKGDVFLIKDGNQEVSITLPYSLIKIGKVWCAELPQTPDEKDVHEIRKLLPINIATTSLMDNPFADGVSHVKKCRTLDPEGKKRQELLQEKEMTELATGRQLFYQERVSKDDRVICELIDEYLGENLMDYMQDNVLSLQDALSLALAVLQTLEDIHRKNVTHSDFKTDNLCVRVEGVKFIIAIIDFGFSQLGQLGRKGCGTPKYLAPELLDGDESILLNKVDEFGAGVTLAEIFGLGEVWQQREKDIVFFLHIYNIQIKPYLAQSNLLPPAIEEKLVAYHRDMGKTLRIGLQVNDDHLMRYHLNYIQTTFNLTDKFMDDNSQTLRGLIEVMAGLTAYNPADRMSLDEAIRQLENIRQNLTTQQAPVHFLASIEQTLSKRHASTSQLSPKPPKQQRAASDNGLFVSTPEMVVQV